MTKTLLKLHILLCSILFFSCSADENEKFINEKKPTYFKINKYDFYFEVHGGEQQLHINTDGNWYISDLPPWILMEQTRGNGDAVLTLKLNINTKEVTRKAKFIIHTAQGKMNVSVIHLHTLFKTDAYPLSFEFNKSGGTKIVKVTSNSPWNVDSVPNWLKLSYKMVDDDLTNLNIWVARNIFTESYKGHFYIKGERDTFRIDVSQEQGDKILEVKPKNFYLDGKAFSSNIKLVSSDSWTLTSEIPDWISINRLTGNRGYDTISIKISDSKGKKRSSVLTFNNEFVQTDVKVEQAAEKIAAGKAAFYILDNFIYKGRYPYGEIAFLIEGNYIHRGHTNLDGVMFTIDGDKIRKGRGGEVAFIKDGQYYKKPNGEIAFTKINNYIVMGRNN